MRLVDWAEPGNEWLAVNQFSITGPKHTRRPDIVLFVNGLPLVLIELKNPADENADLGSLPPDPDLQGADRGRLPVQRGAGDFRRQRGALGSLSADPSASWPGAPSMACLDPLGQFNELETLVRGAWRRALLDYLRYFVLFEDDGDWSRRSPAITSSMRCARP